MKTIDVIHLQTLVLLQAGQLLRPNMFEKFKVLLNTTFLPKWLVLLADMAIITTAFIYTYFLRFNLFEMPVPLVDMVVQIMAGAPVFIAAAWLFKPYVGILRHSTVEDVIILVKAHLFFSGGLFLISILGQSFWPILAIPNSVLLIHFFVSVFFLSLMRFTIQQMYMILFRRNIPVTNVIIYGAGKMGDIAHEVLYKDTNLRYRVVGFIDDNDELWGKRIRGVPVFSPMEAFSGMSRRLNAKEIILAIAACTLTIERKNEIVEECIQNHLKVKEVPDPSTWLNGMLFSSQIREIRIEDLLGRNPINRKPARVVKGISGKNVMVTGGAGSIGSEIVRQLVYLKPASIIIVDQAESAVYDIQNEIRPLLNNTELKVYITTITDFAVMNKIFDECHPHIIYHAAAYKHVPLMEQQPAIALHNNVGGTRCLADVAAAHGTETFVMVSTDKAVNPTNIMGATKRMCEIYIQALSKQPGIETNFITTRFGNVLGSNGSVIPLFKSQIARGGPVTVTHKDVIRYFMTIPEACQLVLEAGFMGCGGEIFMFDMGKPVRIYDLAEKMITLSGLTPHKDIAIVETGLRPGEKLYEEMLANLEQNLPTAHNKILKARIRPLDYEVCRKSIKDLLVNLNRMDDVSIVKAMKAIVPEFKSENSVYQHLDNMITRDGNPGKPSDN